MKKIILVLLAAAMTVLYCFNSMAACRWDDENYGLKAVWDQLDSTGTLFLYKGSSYKVGGKISVSKSKTTYDLTDRIVGIGPGTYHFTITDKAGNTWESESYQVSEEMIDSMGRRTWHLEDGYWILRDYKGTILKGWQMVNGKWYYLDPQTGRCWLDSVTPDGYYVGPDGAWVQTQN